MSLINTLKTTFFLFLVSLCGCKERKQPVAIPEAKTNMRIVRGNYNINNGGYEGKNCTRTSIYQKDGKALAGHTGWKGYFRPKNYTKQL
ncbi:hypothetical protein [Aquimarina longa]|uniref:hypothetical protein n=1 Tax=Aquimarina longa TaxID=1080221 RepID=UPI000785DC2A|nr:hypothetical protein [Aquimarina longa]